VFDEVITGFRVGMGGAQAAYGIRPDLSIFGKVLGGGLPLAAVGGPAMLLDELAPLGAVYQAGTLSGNPLATAAGLAVLAELDDDVYATIEARAAALTSGLAAALGDAGLAVTAPRAFTLAGLFFAAEPVRNYDDARATDTATYARFFHGMLDRGVYFAPSAYEAIFPSLAHADRDIARTIELAADVAASLSANER
jgi:glutamate-1-semialdehyde 2,1-aminomutase